MKRGLRLLSAGSGKADYYRVEDSPLIVRNFEVLERCAAKRRCLIHLSMQAILNLDHDPAAQKFAR